MSTSYSPKIVTDGLVLALDAANRKSYAGSGTTWNDLSGNNNNGTLTNGPTFNAANGGSIVFDGTDDNVNIGNILNYTSTNFSFSYWVNFNSLTTNLVGQGPVVIWKGNFNTSGYYDQISVTGNINFVTNQSGAHQFTSTDDGIIVVGNWYNIAYSRNNNSIIIYLNGNNITQTSATHINPLLTSNNFTLASYSNEQICGNFNLSNLLSYNRALSSQEVLQNFNATRGRFGV